MVEGINLALGRATGAMIRTSSLLGEDIGVNGGVFRATVGLQQRFGALRVQDTPLAEGLIAGMAVGMAAQGLKAGGGNPVHGLPLSGAGPDRQPHGAPAQPHARPPDLPGGDAHAARRRHPRARAPFREPRSAAVPPRRTARGLPVLAGARLRPAARRHPRARPGDLPRTHAPVSHARSRTWPTTARRCRSTAASCCARATTSRSSPGAR